MNNDLISRSALKKVISEYIDEYSDLDNQGYHCEKWCAMKEAEMAIDNAPTVLHDNYAMGYQDGVKKVLSERPQGEWITKEHSIEYYCSHCGERLDQCCEDFCCHCGADMRGGRE